MLKYLKLLIQVNSGHSSKAFFLVSVTLIGFLMLLVVCFILVWEVVTYGTIKTDLMGLSAFVGSVASLFVTAGITKTIGERGEVFYNHSSSHSRVDILTKKVIGEA